MATSMNMGTLLLIVVGVIFVVSRQFREKQAKPFMLLLVPLLVAYHTYLSVQQELARPLVGASLIIAFFVIGVVPGVILGYFRGSLTRMRMDNATRTVYYCPSVANGLFWLGMLVIKIIAGVGIYLRLDHANAPVAVLLAAATTLFLGYVCATCAMLYWRLTRISGSGPMMMSGGRLG